MKSSTCPSSSMFQSTGIAIVPKMHATACLEIKPLFSFLHPGIHAGTDLSRPFLGEFPHHVKSRPPKISEKPRKGAKKRLIQKLSEMPQTFQMASDFWSNTHNRLIDWTQSDQAVRSWSWNHCFSQAFMTTAASSQCIWQTGFCFLMTRC